MNVCLSPRAVKIPHFDLIKLRNGDCLGPRLWADAKILQNAVQSNDFEYHFFDQLLVTNILAGSAFLLIPDAKVKDEIMIESKIFSNQKLVQVWSLGNSL